MDSACAPLDWTKSGPTLLIRILLCRYGNQLCPNLIGAGRQHIPTLVNLHVWEPLLCWIVCLLLQLVSAFCMTICRNRALRDEWSRCTRSSPATKQKPSRKCPCLSQTPGEMVGAPVKLATAKMPHGSRNTIRSEGDFLALYKEENDRSAVVLIALDNCSANDQAAHAIYISREFLMLSLPWCAGQNKLKNKSCCVFWGRRQSKRLCFNVLTPCRCDSSSDMQRKDSSGRTEDWQSDSLKKQNHRNAEARSSVHNLVSSHSDTRFPTKEKSSCAIIVKDEFHQDGSVNADILRSALAIALVTAALWQLQVGCMSDQWSRHESPEDVLSPKP